VSEAKRSEQEADIREAGHLAPAQAKLRPATRSDAAEPEADQESN
jgi:hypothetical protein